MTKHIKVKALCSCGEEVTEKDMDDILLGARKNNVALDTGAKELTALFDKPEK